MELLRQAQEDEQSAFDNLSEGLQASERGQKIEQDASTLEDAISSIEYAVNEIQEVIES